MRTEVNSISCENVCPVMLIETYTEIVAAIILFALSCIKHCSMLDCIGKMRIQRFLSLINWNIMLHLAGSRYLQFTQWTLHWVQTYFYVLNSFFQNSFSALFYISLYLSLKIIEIFCPLIFFPESLILAKIFYKVYLLIELGINFLYVATVVVLNDSSLLQFLRFPT